MNHILVTIVYHNPHTLHNPVMTTTVVPIDSHFAFDSHIKRIKESYSQRKDGDNYSLTFTKI